MTSRRIAFSVVSLLTMAVACAPSEVTSDTPPVAAPATLASPTASTTTPTVVSTTAAESRNSLYQIDPLTLAPIEGADPMSLGDWAWGISSGDGSWLALRVGKDEDTTEEMHLIDVAGWADIASWNPTGDHLLAVDNDGTIYTSRSGGVNLNRWTAGESGPEIEARLPDYFYPGSTRLADRKLLVFGVISDPTTGDLASIQIADLDGGTINSIDFPDVKLGMLEQVDVGEDFFPSISATPTVVWDVSNGRALVVHADEDVVTEVDLATGETVDHSYGAEASVVGRFFAWLVPPASAKGGDGETRRSAVLSDDGSTLFVATSTGDIEVSDDDWSVTTTPNGIVKIDTGSWEVTERLDAPISDIALSPDGSRVIGYGGEMREAPNDSGYESRGYYVIDAENLRVVASHWTGDPELSFSTVDFGPMGEIGYVGYYDYYGMKKIDIVAMNNGALVDTIGAWDLQLFSEAGVLGITE